MHNDGVGASNGRMRQDKAPLGVTGRLKQDHEVIRQQLELLEAALTMPDHPGIIRVACHALARSLTEHIRREERCLAHNAGYLRAVHGYWMVDDHTEFLGLLRDIDTLFLSGGRTPTNVVVDPLSRFVKNLKKHMAMEERAVFPLINQKKVRGTPAWWFDGPVVAARSTGRC